MKALQLTAYGEPRDVLKLVDVPNLDNPAANEIIIRVEASAIEPTDQYIIAGIYGELPALPHFLGCTGVGRVVAIGKNVAHVKVGDRTLVPVNGNAWAEYVKTNATWLRALPDGNVDQLAMLGMNPLTALLLLTEFAKLERGDWLISTAANSAVGRAIIAIAKGRGYRTVNIVRRPELIDELTALGGDVVLVDGPDLPARIAAATGQTKFPLALDGVGGATTQRLLDCLDRYGKLVIWSGMGGEPSPINNVPIIFNGQSLHGFWIMNWLKVPGNMDRLGVLYDELAPLVASGAITLPIAATFGLEQYVEALDLASKFRGKVIFHPDPDHSARAE
ncbi:zinc-dependent alcohol dehydrogenase family protein [Paraburkholderia sp. ZP32-5]|uniref:zinc-dependent alcohol dehydrogenase family protein n=1 Tax=Paraburkholderia sp. ZP32-5 TaxID=2883245 RepID=UPI001F1EF358|nr:zinc-dependent alcohol dehydrogenase family protein [Paraburkholderia sp. ZP32-5]